MKFLHQINLASPKLGTTYIEATVPDMSSLSLVSGDSPKEYAVKAVMTSDSTGDDVSLDSNSNVKLYGPIDVTNNVPSSIQMGDNTDVSNHSFSNFETCTMIWDA